MCSPSPTVLPILHARVYFYEVSYLGANPAENILRARLYTWLTSHCLRSWGHGSRSQIHERTISLKFLGIILRVLRLEVSVYNVYITNQFKTTFSRWGGGGGWGGGGWGKIHW
jgi:hypothetical protein